LHSHTSNRSQLLPICKFLKNVTNPATGQGFLR
jgi:hypothetical protein